ncbi:MFS transporter [Nocardioides sp. KC13]|uniref:MFS transporter n=1 Tax=Nocardioides turkmenicus TaxID=2711220 RepID=A0A6M1QZV6_9ACTN|nr:MFS transporter [Nocardioides sp. KC13]
MTLVAPTAVAAVQKRTILTLVATQAVGAMGITIGIATASLLARDLSGSESMAGLSQTTQVLGAAVAAYVLGRVMDARGRRFGLLAGYLLGAAGGLLAVLAGVVGSMTLLLFGAVLLGATTAANNGARYAATDLAPARSRARALSVVVWATTFGAVIGPNLTGVAEVFSEAVGSRRSPARSRSGPSGCSPPRSWSGSSYGLTRCWSPGRAPRSRRRRRGRAGAGRSPRSGSGRRSRRPSPVRPRRTPRWSR